MPVLVVVPDLLIRSRVLAAAEASGVETVTVQPGDLVSRVADGQAAVVDLDAPGGLEAAKAASARGLRVVGFASHVHEKVLSDATAGGVDAMPRGAFVQRAAEILRSF